MLLEFIQEDGKKLELTEHALEHVLKGNFVIRPMKDREDMKVLSGGLHTCEAWIDFRNCYGNKLEHLHFYNSSQHSFWYYARELGNGVVTLRLPRELFSGKAASITMYPDDYYKSGYLWKTLFPIGYDREKIIQVVEEALANEDITQRKKGQIVGYINKDDPLSKMKIVIQHRGKEIKSVFPAWTQPNTGNNGKPYSHYDNIGFVIAQSTEYFNDEVKLYQPSIFNFTGDRFKVNELPLYTPRLFRDRNNPKAEQSLSDWKKSRIIELNRCSLDREQNDLIYNYLNDFSLVKYYPEIISGAYSHAWELIANDTSIYNSSQVVQNIVDGINYLYFTGQSDRLVTTIEFLLANMVTHTLFDLMSKKRILSSMINVVVGAKSPELSYKFLLGLSQSPVRREAYIEYNIDSLSKKKLSTLLPLNHFPDELALIKNPSLELGVKFDDFIEILKEALGETYTLNFNDDDLYALLNSIVENQEPNFKNLVIESLRFFSSEDFTSLSAHIEGILETAERFDYGDKELLSTTVGLILRDYCRIQFAHRQRINARYINYHDYTGVMYLPIDSDLLFGTILKHERWTNSMNLETFIDGVIGFSDRNKFKGLKNDALNFKSKIGREKPPLPEREVTS
ncbi:hypothetical protein [Enterovibrio norvegicus]|uniref:Uncharacterized protein n=1 Tax=Enterovibrio norvegicus DSM 15893 TaxID=1121869 RepID=A0A1I5VJS2_9GAMM|nr:hypothetical protein [Enterovibrio norvegicus]SFQ07236.1 hypothetical protein SAMN03084138_03965 [Enterovibrio norvegicus DSM 15893]